MTTTTSVKHRDFVTESMAGKDVSAVAGIGEAYAKKLREEGFDEASVLFGQFLLLRKDEEKFADWLKEFAGVNTRHARACASCFAEWALQHM
ncbi:barrier to autointegration factor [Trichuris trichiura]|uniref:Barrier-to-autointegration factor 1 n=1 Tax=Trichuris trichiura TaxID=36087 RepID=A0A077ZFN1_TRITR|nr:barrier to autointegration factor [Trichuris trichiura]